MNTSNSFEPYTVLGVHRDASEAEIRARYLELVKQFPPERDPDKFRAVQAAFEAAKDPLLIARRLVEPPSDEAPQWSTVLEEQKQNPPALSSALLLSFGNRDDTFRQQEANADENEAPHDQATGNDPNQKQHFIEQPHE